jgi:hypothetical protein
VKSDLLADIDRRHGAYRNTLDQGQIYEERALPIISRHPLLFSVYLFNGAVRILAGMGAEIPFELLGKPVPVIRYESTISARGTLQLIRAYGALAPFVVAYGVALMALYTAFVWGIVCLRRSGKTAEAQFLLLGAAYFLALSSVLGYYRFRISLMPFLVIGAAFAFPERNPPYRKDVLP